MLINPKHCALIFLLIGFINAGPTSRSLLKGEIKCAKKCTDSRNFNYQIGRSYRYNFETKNEFTPETGDVLNSVKITGHAKITIQSNCEHVLQLENVNVEGASKDQKEKLIKELEANNLAYSFQDGEINNICPLASESKNGHVLNIKKAILSALQFSPKQQLNELSTSNVDEKDINGNCETTYELQNSNADQYKVIKSKKLKSCSNRLNADSATLGTSSIAGEITNFFANMYIENDHRCKILIKKSGIIESVKCTESSNSPSFIQKDLRNHHEIILKYSNEEPVHYPQLTGEYYEDSLLGEKIDLIDEDANKVTSGKELKNAVQSICQSISNSTLNHQTANKFRDLVNVVRHSKSDLIKTELTNLLSKREMSNKNHNEVMATSTCCPHKLFKLYLEALISAKTDASLKLLVNDIVPNNFYLQEGSIRAEIKLISFYTSLAFYRHPNEETLRAALPLLKIKGRHTRNALFGITGLARTICKNEKNCNLPAITELANSIAENIPSNCAVKSSNENQVIESLKALENLQTLPEPVLKKMITCLSTANVSPNVKVSVIKNFDGKTNQDLVKKAIKDVLLNSNEEDEVRIQAYKRYKKQVTKENAKEIEKLVSSAKGELASYIANDIQRLRNEKHMTCPIILAFLDATKDIDLKFTQQQGKSKTVVSHPLRPFFKSNLAVYTDIMYSAKTEKPLNVISSFRLRSKEILEIGLRSESGSNLLLNIANVETVIDGVLQMIKNMNAKPEDGQSRVIDELAAKILPELSNAFKDVDLYVKVGGRNLVYLNKNDQQLAVGNRLDKLKLGLAPILAMEQNSVFQIHSVSGIPTIVKKDKTILSNFVLFDTQKVNDKEVKFEITPNLIINQLVKVSYPIGRHQNSFVLENEQYLTTNFGLLGSKTDSNDKTQIRLKLSSKKVELLSHRVFNRIRQGSTVKEVAPVKKNRDICLEQFLPIRKALGVSICSKNNDDEKSIILEKTEDSNVLITLQKEKSGSSINKKITIEQENSPHKRRLSVAVGQSEPGSTTLNFEIENPLGKGLAKVTTSKDKLNIQAKLDDHQVYSLDAVKSLDSKGKESNFKAKVSVSFPGIQKPWVTQFTAKVINDKKLHVSGDLTVNEKHKIIAYEYNAEGQNSRLKRSADYSLKTDFDLKVFNLKGLTLGHSKYNGEYKSSGVKMSHLIEYPTSKANPEKLEQLQMDYKLSFEHSEIDKFNISSQLRSSQYPKLLNYKYEQIFVSKSEKELEHYENVIEMEFDFLGTGDERKIRLNQVSKINGMFKNSKKSSMEHLIRIVINKFNYNREITYNGNYEALGNNFYSINDKLKIQDISAATEILSGSISLKSTDPSDTKFKFLVDYNCNKHGKFNWAEDIIIDPKTKAVSTKIVLTVSRANSSPTVYNGEYKSSEIVLIPKSFDLKLRKASDNTEVLHIKRDFSNPNEKMTYVNYYGKRVYDFEMKTSPKTKLVESLKLKVENVGELKLDANSNTNEGNKFTYKLKLNTQQPYQQNAVLVCGKKVLSLDFNVLRGDTKTLQIELYLSNPKKTLVTYRDVESGSILVKVYNTQISFKHDNQPTGFSSMFELQKLDQKKKLIVMCDRDATKFSLMTKLEKDGAPVYTFDSTYSKTTSSVINFKSDKIVLNININPFGSNEDDWKVLTIDFTRKDGKYKHSSKINIKKLSNKKAIAIKSSSSGKRSENDISFEHDLDFQLSRDWSNLKFNAKLSEGDKVDQIDYHHDLNTQDMKGYGYKLNHHLKLTIKSELLFSHELNSKLDHNDNKYEFTSNSDVKAKCKYINGIKLNMKGDCDTKEKTGKFNLNLEHPYKNNVITANYNAKNSLKTKFSRELRVEVQNTKLNEKQLYLGKVDMIEGLELHLKYNKESSKGHQLENLELRVLSKTDEVSLVVVAPRGWSGHVKFLPPNNKFENMSFSLNLTKRGRVLLAVDSKFQLKQNGSRKRRAITINKKTEATIHTVIGFNGNPKFAEENIEINSDQLTYKFTSVYYNVDANLKGLSSEKKTFYLKGCSAKQVTNCAVFDANIERTGKGTKSIGTFKYGLDDEAINVKYDYNREKLDNGDYKGKLSGEINNKKFTGEILVKKNTELTITINLPERVIKFERELKSNGFKDTLWPNYEKDVKHAHALSYTITKSAEKRLHELRMDHPSFKRPLITSIEVVNKKSVAVLVDVVNDENKKIHINLFKDIEPKGKTVKVGLHFFRADRKIDFGFLQERIIVGDSDKSVKVIQKRSQHWVDRNGKNRTITRDQEAEVKYNSVEAVYDITTKDLLKSMTEYYNIDGKLHLDLKKRIANGVYDWAIDSLTKKKTEFDYKDNCLKVDSYDLPKNSYKNNHLINLCAMNKLSDSDLVKFEYIKPEYNAKKKLVNSEKLIFKLSKAEEQQLRLLLKWDPEQIGEWIVEGGEYVERRQKEEQDALVFLQSEIEDKFNLLRDQFANELIEPMRKHRVESFKEILNEINPKLAAKFRSKRAVVAKKNDTETNLLNFSENLAKKLFNFKVIKFSPEEGIIELTFSSHPSFEGIKYGMKNSINYLFKE